MPITTTTTTPRVARHDAAASLRHVGDPTHRSDSTAGLLHAVADTPTGKSWALCSRTDGSGPYSLHLRGQASWWPTTQAGADGQPLACSRLAQPDGCSRCAMILGDWVADQASATI